jgi:hypothetical protein
VDGGVIAMRFLFLACVAGGFATGVASKPVCKAPEPDWRQDVTPVDVTRLHEVRESFVKALAQARAGDHGNDVAREGLLLDPDAAIDGAALPVGDYHCRTIKLGSQSVSGPSFVSYPALDCRVTANGKVSRFVRVNGLQRPTGALNYGRDTDRNMIGAVERIGPRRWRMVLPYPRFDSTLDVIDLVPAN